MGRIRFRTFIAPEVADEHKDNVAYEVVERLSELPLPHGACPSPDPSDNTDEETTPPSVPEYDEVPEGVTEAIDTEDGAVVGWDGQTHEPGKY